MFCAVAVFQLIEYAYIEQHIHQACNNGIFFIDGPHVVNGFPSAVAAH